jgi:hypothetical protein
MSSGSAEVPQEKYAAGGRELRLSIPFGSEIFDVDTTVDMLDTRFSQPRVSSPRAEHFQGVFL